MSWWIDRLDTAGEAADWAASGAMDLTGYPDGSPGHGPGAPASLVRAALAEIAELAPHANLPGVELLGERAAIAGLRRRGPWSPGGSFQALPTTDGWVGLSLARESDLELVPALVEAPVADAWSAVASWLSRVSSAEAEERIVLLGLPGAAIPPEPPGAGRDPVTGRPGRSRSRTDSPLVIDLTALWAGPLCARLLGLTGARVVKVEDRLRLDGARRGPAAFYELLHDGHDSVVLDFRDPAGLARLRRLLDEADVVLEASRPRALRQLGLVAEEYVDAGKVWTSITAYGRDADRVGFGDDVAAGAGLVRWERDRPIPVGDAIADPLAGVAAAASTLRALQSDRGCLLDVSMRDVAAYAANPTR